MGECCIDSRFLDLGTSWRWVVSFTPRSPYPREYSHRYPLERRLSAPHCASGRHREVEILPPPRLEVRSLGRPARSQSLTDCTIIFKKYLDQYFIHLWFIKRRCHRAALCSCNALDLSQSGTVFESPAGSRLSWLRFIAVFLRPFRRPRQLPFKIFQFVVNEKSYQPKLYTLWYLQRHKP
jgi:hypothetical protein